MRNVRLETLVLIVALHACEVRAASVPAPSPAAVRGWVRDLDDDRFEVREAAGRHLVGAGRHGIPAVAAAAAGENLEVQWRSIDVLRNLTTCAEAKTASAATTALEQLAASPHPVTAPLARRALLFRQHEVARALRRCGADIDITPDSPVTAIRLDRAELTPQSFALLRKLPDLESLSLSNPRMDDACMSELRGLPKLRQLNLYGSGVGDAGLASLKGLPALRSIPMGGTKVTDAGLVHLRDLVHLDYVGLRGDRVTDAGLVHLRGLKNLTGLNLSETRVTDAGLGELSHMKRLTHLDLRGTVVTETGLARLRRLLPDVRVMAGPL